MKKGILFFTISILIFSFGCTESLDETLLHGEWQADQFLENGKVKDLDVSNMGFTFNDQNVYTYQSNLKGGEAGNYRIEGTYLYTTDTLNDQRMEKVVNIGHINADSLFIDMNNGGIDQTIILHKKK